MVNRTEDQRLTEALCFEGEKDYQIDQLLDYLHYDPDTRSHPDWVARAQTAEAEVERLSRELADEKRRSFQGSRISYRGFSYGVGSQHGIDSLRRAIEDNGHG